MRRSRLLEVALFALVIVILAAVAVPRYLRVLEQTREKQVMANAALLQLRLEEFARETGGLYPMDFETRARDLNPHAQKNFNVNEVLGDASVNPYLEGMDNVFDRARADSPSISGHPGVVLYIPGDPAADSGVPYTTTYRIIGFGKEGERLDFDFRGDTPPR
jgi:type II secretory pathway pseudopilin PulG